MASIGDNERSRSLVEQRVEGAKGTKECQKNSYHQPGFSPCFLPHLSVYFTIYDFLLSRRGSNIDTLTASGARLLLFV